MKNYSVRVRPKVPDMVMWGLLDLDGRLRWRLTSRLFSSEREAKHFIRHSQFGSPGTITGMWRIVKVRVAIVKQPRWIKEDA